MFYERINGDGYPTIGVDLDEHYVILSRKGNKPTYYNTLYKQLWDEELNGDEMKVRGSWCEENCSGEWLIGCSVSGFEKEEDFCAYKLRWG